MFYEVSEDCREEEGLIKDETLTQLTHLFGQHRSTF